jgi:hypothetical protein
MQRFGFVHGPRQIDSTIMQWHPAETDQRTQPPAQQAGGSQITDVAEARVGEPVLPTRAEALGRLVV